MTRGTLYIAWKGYIDPTPAIERSVDSLKRWHPELEHHVHWMLDGQDLRCKAHMHELSPFDSTLFLDADTVVMGRLDYGFEQAEKHGMALAINANPWARRYRSMEQSGDVIEYNTGVMFFDRTREDVKEVFTRWDEMGGLDSSCAFLAKDGVFRMPVNDQCSFAAAVYECGFNPFVLPVNWNCQPKWQRTIFGPLKIWHTYAEPPQEKFDKWNAEQTKPGGLIKCGTMPEWEGP